LIFYFCRNLNGFNKTTSSLSAHHIFKGIKKTEEEKTVLIPSTHFKLQASSYRTEMNYKKKWFKHKSNKPTTNSLFFLIQSLNKLTVCYNQSKFTDLSLLSLNNLYLLLKDSWQDQTKSKSNYQAFAFC